MMPNVIEIMAGDMSQIIDLAKTNLKSVAQVYNVQGYGAKGDGVTDDAAAIQAALNAASAAGGGVVWIPYATYIIGASLNIPSNVHIVLEGTIKLKNGANTNVMMINGASNIIIEGSGKIDGNKANQTYSMQSPIGGIYSTAGSSNIVIRGITVTNVGNWPLNIVGSHTVFVEDCVFSNSGNSCEFAAGSYNCWMQNCEISNITADYGFAFYGGVYNSGIIGCDIHDNNIGGITVFNDNGQPAVCHDIVIDGNVCYNNNYSGIIVDSNQTPVVKNYGIVISNNIVHHNNKSNVGGQGGIWIRTGTQISIIGNISHHNGNGANSSVGINIDPQGAGVSFVTIKGNNIFDEGIGSTLGVSIQLGAATTSNILIEGNIMNDDQTSKTTAFHLNGGGGANIIVRNNILGSSIGAPNNMTAGTKNIWEGNIGYNPVGQVTAPAVPASGTAVTNNFAVPVRVFVIGGTMTSIAINGQSIGGSVGSILLMPGETITLNYTVAPTWTWFGL